ncbi:MAG: hypothetical protein MZV65_54020 [Chromatiales bacterium]|nr:hypothetical protein [Chromatiales bacterium]
MRYRFKHPTKADFVGVVNEVSARDMTWFFDELLEGTEAFDYGIASVYSVKVPVRPRGVYDAAGSRVEITDKKIKELEAAAAKAPGKAAPPVFRSTVVLEALRRGPAGRGHPGRGLGPLQGRNDRKPDLGRTGPLGPPGIRQAGRGRERPGRSLPAIWLIDESLANNSRGIDGLRRNVLKLMTPVPCSRSRTCSNSPHRGSEEAAMGIVKAIVNGDRGRRPASPGSSSILYTCQHGLRGGRRGSLFAIVQAELGHSYLGSNVRPLDLSWLGEAALKSGDAAPALVGRPGRRLGPLPRRSRCSSTGEWSAACSTRRAGATLGAFFGDCGRYLGRFSPALPRLARLPLPDLRRHPPAPLGRDRAPAGRRRDRVAAAHPGERPPVRRPPAPLDRPDDRRLRPDRRRRRRRAEGARRP